MLEPSARSITKSTWNKLSPEEQFHERMLEVSVSTAQS